jgi:hypothetical protein
MRVKSEAAKMAGFPGSRSLFATYHSIEVMCGDLIEKGLAIRQRRLTNSIIVVVKRIRA